MSIINTITSNITVLVSHNVVCFEYFIPMNYGVNSKAYPISSCLSPGLHYTRFLLVLVVVLREIRCQDFFTLNRLLQKKIHFQSKTIFFKLLLFGYDFNFLCICIS